jgi:hypothetical protein
MYNLRFWGRRSLGSFFKLQYFLNPVQTLLYNFVVVLRGVLAVLFGFVILSAVLKYWQC